MALTFPGLESGDNIAPHFLTQEWSEGPGGDQCFWKVPVNSKTPSKCWLWILTSLPMRPHFSLFLSFLQRDSEREVGMEAPKGVMNKVVLSYHQAGQIPNSGRTLCEVDMAWSEYHDPYVTDEETKTKKPCPPPLLSLLPLPSPLGAQSLFATSSCPQPSTLGPCPGLASTEVSCVQIVPFRFHSHLYH